MILHLASVSALTRTMSECSVTSRYDKSISLRLLALILCSNCSNTFNKVLIPMWDHTVKLLFETSGFPFSLLNISHGWSKHFTSRYDPSTPFTPPPNTKTHSHNTHPLYQHFTPLILPDSKFQTELDIGSRFRIEPQQVALSIYGGLV